jgi:hypothetical protein
MALNVEQEYNVLKECLYIRNKDQCVHDTNTGYEVMFNRDRGGWTVSSGIEVSYSKGYFLWGVSTQSECMVGLSDDITETFEADYFNEFEVEIRS